MLESVIRSFVKEHSLRIQMLQDGAIVLDCKQTFHPCHNMFYAHACAAGSPRAIAILRLLLHDISSFANSCMAQHSILICDKHNLQDFKSSVGSKQASKDASHPLQATWQARETKLSLRSAQCSQAQCPALCYGTAKHATAPIRNSNPFHS